jgi:hypothetical protein
MVGGWIGNKYFSVEVSANHGGKLGFCFLSFPTNNPLALYL